MMSVKERRRLAVLDRVKAGDLTRQAAAARLGVSYRQMLRTTDAWSRKATRARYIGRLYYWH